jgi:hypothetical protein
MKFEKSAQSSRATGKVTIVDVEITSDQRAYIELIARTVEIPYDDVLAVIVADYILREEVQKRRGGQ